MQEAGKVSPIEERQPVLHVVVFGKYSERPPEPEPKTESEASEATEAEASGFIGSQP